MIIFSFIPRKNSERTAIQKWKEWTSILSDPLVNSKCIIVPVVNQQSRPDLDMRAIFLHQIVHDND
jgi:hypothetical protein